MPRSVLLAVSLLLLASPARAAQQDAPEAPVQQNIPRLRNFLSLATVLNLGRGAVRILAVVSPSSETASEGMECIAATLRDIPSKRLRVYVILSHASPEDTEIRALALASRHRDRRIVYIWDPEGIAAVGMAPVVGATRADDVYFLYDTAATFTTEPAQPALWMHLSPDIEGRRLDASALGAKAAELVRAVEQKASDAVLKGE